MSPGRNDDTVDLPKVEALNEASETGGKRCCSCGKDLRGHRRFKDSEGYWCKNCHRTDNQRKKIPEGRCPDCGRMRPLDKLFTTSKGDQVCSSCLKERKVQEEKYELREAVEAAAKWEERRKIFIMLGILLALGLILLIQQGWKMMHH